MKQIDRLLSNVAVDSRVHFPAWIRFVVGVRTALIVALDWTEFDDDARPANGSVPTVEPS